jgi:hypothetical protein
MKKIVLTAAVFALTVSSVFSQNFKPKEKEIAVGIAFDSPFSSGKPFSLINGVSGRYFYKSDLAFRGTLNLGSSSSSKTTYKADATGNQIEDFTNKKSNSNFDLYLGAEKHFAGTDRLDPYAGADLIIGREKTSSKTTPKDMATYAGSLSSKQASSIFGLRLVVGADYYVFSKVYVGTEFGITYRRTSAGDETAVDRKVGTDGALGDVTTVTPGDKTGSSGSIFTDMTTAAFRVGFRF